MLTAISGPVAVLVERQEMKILGYDYKLAYFPLHGKLPLESAGVCSVGQQTIMVDGSLCKQQLKSTVLHEMIEAVNRHLELELSHHQIVLLEAGLYNALTENGVSLSVLLKELK